MARTNYLPVLTIICIVTLTFDQWPWIKVMILPWVQCNNSVKYYSNLCFQWKLMARTMFKPSWAWWPLTLDQGHDTSLGPGQQLSEILFKFINRGRSYGPDKLFAYILTIMCIVTLTVDQWPWIKLMTHFLGSNVTILWNIIQIHAFSEKLWPGQCLNPYEHSDLDLWPWIKVMTFP
jgi:hypothetical protein